MEDQLTCRRIKDCCALIHNSVVKWNSLTDESFDVISTLMKGSTEEQYVRHTKFDNAPLEIPENKTRLEGKIIEEREKNYKQLRTLVAEMVFCIAVSRMTL